VIDHMNDNVSAGNRLADADSVYIRPAVLTELMHGALYSARPTENLDRLSQVVGNTICLDCTAETDRAYASVYTALRKQGRPVPLNDIWIAATAWSTTCP